MTNFKKNLQQQKEINEAVQALFTLLGKEIGYDKIIESMSNAQTAIMVMTTHYHRLLQQFEDEEDKPYYEDITTFLWIVSELCKVIKPFAEIIGNINAKRIG